MQLNTNVLPVPSSINDTTTISQGEVAAPATPSNPTNDKVALLEKGPWPCDFEMDTEMAQSPVIRPYSNAWIHLYRDKYVVKTSSPGPDIQREAEMMLCAGDCAVELLGRVSLNGKVMGLIMPFEKAIDAGGNLSTERRLAMMDEIVELMNRLHAKGIIHGDVNMSNLLSCSDCKIRFCDFGNAALETLQFVPRQITSLCCSQYKLKNICTPWTKSDDLYALGITLYHLITGHRPYLDVDDDALEDVIADGVFPDLSIIEDPRARALIAKFLEAAPKWEGISPEMLSFEELEVLGRTHVIDRQYTRINYNQEDRDEPYGNDYDQGDDDEDYADEDDYDNGDELAKRGDGGEDAGLLISAVSDELQESTSKRKMDDQNTVSLKRPKLDIDG